MFASFSTCSCYNISDVLYVLYMYLLYPICKVSPLSDVTSLVMLYLLYPVCKMYLLLVHPTPFPSNPSVPCRTYSFNVQTVRIEKQRNAMFTWKVHSILCLMYRISQNFIDYPTSLNLLQCRLERGPTKLVNLEQIGLSVGCCYLVCISKQAFKY